MLKNTIVPVVLHKVVENMCIDFEDITVSSLKKVLSKDPKTYITIQDIDANSINHNKLLYLVTFDDGYLSNYTIVFPLLKRLGIKATFFINTSNIGKSGFLTWEMIIEMQKKGNMFGSHGHNHLKMTEISLIDSKFEFIKSKELYESNTGIQLKIFSFPYGQFNKGLLELAEECGYSNCFVSKHGVINSIEKIIPRNSINSSMDELNILKTLNPSSFIRSKWAFEDAIKYIIKKIIGEKYYLFLRNFLLRVL